MAGNELCTVLYFCTTLLMIATVVAAVLLFIYYTRDPACIANKLFIAVNSMLCMLICVCSILPCTTRSEPYLLSIMRECDL